MEEEQTGEEPGAWDKLKGFLGRLSRPGDNEGDTKRAKKRDGTAVDITYTGGRWMGVDGKEYKVQPGGFGGEVLADEIGQGD